MLARPLVAAAVLLTAGAGSVLVVGGTSAADGPVVAGPVAGPLAMSGPVAAGPGPMMGPVAAGLVGLPSAGIRSAVVRHAVSRAAINLIVAPANVLGTLPLAVSAPRMVVGPVVPPSLPELPPAVVVPSGPPLGPPVGAALVGPPGVLGPDSPLHQVRTVQRLLNRAGAALRIDGAWGPATTRAVSAVQARAGLPVDGRVGPRTLAVLRGQAVRP